MLSINDISGTYMRRWVFKIVFVVISAFMSQCVPRIPPSNDSLLSNILLGMRSAVGAPTTPGLLAGVPISTSRIDLSWSASVDDTTVSSDIVYQICLASSAGGCSPFQSTYSPGSGVLSFSASGLNPSTTYYFSIRAVDGLGNPSPSSREIAVATQSITTTGTPTFSPLPGVYGSSQSISISSATPGAVLCYRTDGVDPAACTAGPACDPAATTYGGAFFIGSTTQIRAIACSTGLFDSAVNNVTYTIDTSAPAPTPTFNAPVPISTSQIDLSWTASLDASGTVTYDVCYAPTLGGCTPFGGGGSTVTSTTSTSFSVTGLSPATTYFFAVRARDIVNNTTIADTSSATTQAIGTVNTPTFSPPAGTYGTSQLVTVSTTSPAATICFTTDGSIPVCALPGCATGTANGSSFTHTVSVNETLNAVACEVGFTDSANNGATYIIDTTPPSPDPVLNSPVPMSPTQIDLTWSASTDPSGTVTYEVCIGQTFADCNSPFGSGTSSVFTTTATSFSATGLTPLTTYFFAVRAKDIFANTGAASPGSGTTLSLGTVNTPVFTPNGPPNEYPSLIPSVTIATGTPGAIICYRADGSSPACNGPKTGCAGIAALYSGGFPVNATQTIEAIACKPGFLDSAVNSITYKIDTGPPSVPTGLNPSAVPISGGKVDLSWIASTDDITPAGSIVYEICQSTSPGVCTGSFTATYTVTGGTFFSTSPPGETTIVTTYYYAIRARDQFFHFSSLSSEQSITTTL